MIMFKGWWQVLPDEERQQWMLEPFVGVGPLRFGMSPDEVADAMDDVTAETERHQRHRPANSNVSTVVQGVYPKFGLHLYYRDGGLVGVVVDALCGPQVSVEGTALVGRVPSVLEQWMVDRAETLPPESELVYMSAGVPASESLGVTINVQREGDRLLTRPVFYPAEALDDLSHWLPSDVWAIHD
ncbi:hypothetical protein OG455_08365 [Kitasatospora sp. NBC_01287]|uniref:hypothetical protein n=1 Tax=Kitasatospora sp. NBC_01287 TaxID=2903573 RepID=UPI002259BD40|nr:hypothetical protein [Kitasatospora sp. NBC_01287]MCX4745535.1 hypothetical protein [Kitasatospora sp. NBC_01287]